MSIAIDTAGTDRPGLQRLLDSLWYAVLRDELVGREAERRSKVDIGALTKQVASLLPDAALSEIPTPIHVAPESGRCGQSTTFVIGIHRFWPCAASGPPPEPLAEALEALLHRFLAPEASAILRKRVGVAPPSPSCCGPTGTGIE